ncbi:hypothetical protein UB46_01915 [Burkholderiaceae bacterium 16]|nr:hypothetical protein UB46_01915 [Burkholderiaceae bacterium 16]
MEVEYEVRAAHQFGLDKMGNHLGGCATRISGIEAIQVSLIYRRHAITGFSCRVIRHRQDDEMPLNIVGLQLSRQARQCHLPFVFVAMGSRQQQHGLTYAVLDAHYRDGKPSVRRAIH